MLVKPSRSKAIPIVKPAEEETVKDGKDRKEHPPARLRPLVQDVAIQQAAHAISSLRIGSKPTDTASIPVSNQGSIPGSVHHVNGKHNNPRSVRMETENQKKRLVPTDDDDDQEDYESGFNIYARPFIPEIFTVINTLPGRQILTHPIKTTDFDDYISRSLGPATGFLPQPLPIRLPTTTSSFTEGSSISPKYYEEFFQFHLHQEIQAQQMENEAYSRK